MSIDEKVSYSVEDKNNFVIKNYNCAKSFASFLPGIAGRMGIPLWTYYVNRGQGVCSMGVKNKDHQIMEFLSFNKAVQLIESQGFRTFLKTAKGILWEPFKKSGASQRQKIYVWSDKLTIEDTHQQAGLNIRVTYFQLAGEKIPALIRKVELTNISAADMNIDMVDGLPKIFPYGTNRQAINVIPRHIEGLMKVYDHGGIPLYRLKINPEDKPEIERLEGNNFYFTVESGEIIKDRYLADPYTVFKNSKNYDFPYNFKEKTVRQLLSMKEIRKNKTPSAFTAFSKKINSGQTLKFHSVIGYAASEKLLDEFIDRAAEKKYFIKKEKEIENIIEEVKNNMLTLSKNKRFNEYAGQTFMDNVLRGGMPMVFDTAEGKEAFYLYSRQNGDLERDYHDFVIEPTYYSQGNGHYRCIIQNRRMDNFFLPEINDANIKFFLNAMQTDGYNPIEVRSTTYTIADDGGFKRWASENVKDKVLKRKLFKLTSGSFMPGEVAMLLESDKLMQKVLSFSRQNVNIDLHSRPGFWIDHWSYNLDLIEAYLGIYPDKIEDLFFNSSYTFYDNPDRLLPRDEKFILKSGRVRQYESVYRDNERIKEINSRESSPRIVRKKDGKGEIYRTNLIVKLLTLTVNRIASLDPENRGCEMDANKPGWNDSINGLPGILGSSICHTLELSRYCTFLVGMLSDFSSKEIKIFSELKVFMDKLFPVIKERIKNCSSEARFKFWDKSHTIKEEYHKKIVRGVSGKEEKVKIKNIADFMVTAKELLDSVISEENKDKVFNSEGIPYTYFINDAVKWEKTGKKDSEGNELVRVKEFSQRPVTPFLEGPVRFLRVYPERAKEIYNNIRASGIFDPKLKSYRNNESLENDRFEIGRIKAWGRGWIENESLYTHMLFKYMLAVLKSGLYEEFFADIKNFLMPFLDPGLYGRSIFENVSFIVSSAFEDEKMHGQGLQARLSGSTCEFINMWVIMTSGENPFITDKEGNLKLKFNPILPSEFFTTVPEKVKFYISGDNRKKAAAEEIELPGDTFTFKFLNAALVVYHNPDRKNTYGKDKVAVARYKLTFKDGAQKEIEGDFIYGTDAMAVRNKEVRRIDAFLK